MTNFQKIAQEIIDNDFYVAGVRAICNDEEYSIGDIARESYEWDLENDCSTYETTGESANGTCAVGVEISYDADELAEKIENAAKKALNYGNQLVVLAGNSVNNDGYFDNGEIRIINAKVIAIVEED